MDIYNILTGQTGVHSFRWKLESLFPSAMHRMSVLGLLLLFAGMVPVCIAEMNVYESESSSQGTVNSVTIISSFNRSHALRFVIPDLKALRGNEWEPTTSDSINLDIPHAVRTSLDELRNHVDEAEDWEVEEVVLRRLSDSSRRLTVALMHMNKDANASGVSKDEVIAHYRRVGGVENQWYYIVRWRNIARLDAALLEIPVLLSGRPLRGEKIPKSEIEEGLPGQELNDRR